MRALFLWPTLCCELAQVERLVSSRGPPAGTCCRASQRPPARTHNSRCWSCGMWREMEVTDADLGTKTRVRRAPRERGENARFYPHFAVGLQIRLRGAEQVHDRVLPGPPHGRLARRSHLAFRFGTRRCPRGWRAVVSRSQAQSRAASPCCDGGSRTGRLTAGSVSTVGIWPVLLLRAPPGRPGDSSAR